nr:50S ribosomal protein L21, mitochondrial-like [Ipomoea batatas]
MATRRCLRILTRHYSSFLPSPNPSLKTLNPAFFDSLRNLTFSQDCLHISTKSHTQYPFISRNFCSKHNDGSEDESGDEGEEEFDDFSDDDGDAELREANSGPKSPEDKIKEAAEIGYKVIGPLEKSDRAFKPYEPVFAVVQLILNKVLMLGSQTQTIIGRPILPEVAVHAVVEEHALDAKVLIFKKKRRKNYRRTRGHRQELTKLRITDIQGIKKPEVMPSLKTGKSGAKPADKVAVAA